MLRGAREQVCGRFPGSPLGLWREWSNDLSWPSGKTSACGAQAVCAGAARLGRGLGVDRLTLVIPRVRVLKVYGWASANNGFSRKSRTDGLIRALDTDLESRCCLSL